MSPVRDSRDHSSHLDRMQAEAEHRKREEILKKGRRPAERNQFGATKINKIGTVLNNSCQFKIQGHMLNRDRSSQDITVVHDVPSKESFNKVKVRLSEINKHVSDGINKDSENQKRRKTSASPRLSW